MAASETTIGPTNRECDGQNGYFWYICSLTTPAYSGCCRVDPCNEQPIGCPASAAPQSELQETVLTVTSYVPSSTLTITRTASHQVSSASSPLSSDSSTSPSSSFPSTSFSSSIPTPTPGASAPTSPTISSISTANNDNSKGNGLTISVSALIGIVLACGIVSILAALSLCMWWGRRRRQKIEKREQAQRAVSSRGLDEDLVPPGLDSVFNPMAQTGPGSVFDRGEGRIPEGNGIPGFSPLARDPHLSNLSSATNSGFISPLSPGSSWGLGLPPSPSELDSMPAGLSAQQNGVTELDSRHVAREETEGAPRATLNSTQQEREAGTYANSWTKFNNVQL